MHFEIKVSSLLRKLILTDCLVKKQQNGGPFQVAFYTLVIGKCAMRQVTNCPGNVSFLLLAVSNNIYALTTLLLMALLNQSHGILKLAADASYLCIEHLFALVNHELSHNKRDCNNGR